MESGIGTRIAIPDVDLRLWHRLLRVIRQSQQLQAVIERRQKQSESQSSIEIHHRNPDSKFSICSAEGGIRTRKGCPTGS